jgi:hypothetical protein
MLPKSYLGLIDINYVRGMVSKMYGKNELNKNSFEIILIYSKKYYFIKENPDLMSKQAFI